MIKSWYVMGDTHGSLYALQNVECVDKEDEAVIILGDVGFNFYLNKRDAKRKEIIMQSTKCYYYCLRGNHEARPQSIEGMQKIYDENVQNWVYMEPQYPRIRYFLDYGVYMIGKYRVAMIGGAYSVDKWYRLDNGAIWFPDEQLTEEELAGYELFCTEEGADCFHCHGGGGLALMTTNLFYNNGLDDEVNDEQE